MCTKCGEIELCLCPKEVIREMEYYVTRGMGDKEYLWRDSAVGSVCVGKARPHRAMPETVRHATSRYPDGTGLNFLQLTGCVYVRRYKDCNANWVNYFIERY